MLRDFSKEEFDILVQAGQSNSEGCGLGDVEKPYAPREDILYLNNDFTISLAQEIVSGNYAVGNFALPFAACYAESGLLRPNRKILILRAAVGGTGFLDHRWGLHDDLFLRMMEMIGAALALNGQNRIAAFLWHQGETDAILGADKKTHAGHLTVMINAVRETYGAPALPIVMGDFVQEWKLMNTDICAPVTAAMRNVCAAAGRARFVETDGLASNRQRMGSLVGEEETIHFCREALYQLGKRYFDAFCMILR